MIEHNAGDLTAVVSADTRLGELQGLVGGAGQMLALDPPGDPTLSEAVLGNLSGPLRHRYGSLRDLLLGVRVRLPDGTEAKAGGKVIKNVAGYDLAKLYVGSEGTLGEVLECAVRLHPLPRPSRTSMLRSSDPAELQEAALDLSHRPLELLSLDIRWDGTEGVLLARSAEGILDEPADGSEWERQRELQAGDGVVRVSCLQTQLADLLRFGAPLVGRAGLGLHWVRTPDEEGLRDALGQGPADPGALELMRRVRERFAA